MDINYYPRWPFPFTPADLNPQPGSLNDLGFCVYKQHLLIHCAAAIVFAQVSSETQSTTSCQSVMMHILLPYFAADLDNYEHVCLARAQADLLNS